MKDQAFRNRITVLLLLCSNIAGLLFFSAIIAAIYWLKTVPSKAPQALWAIAPFAAIYIGSFVGAYRVNTRRP